MLTVTESANAHLADVLVDAPTEAVVRFTVRERSLTPQLDTPREGDVAFAHQGRKVLVLEPRLAELLSDRILDVCDTDAGEKLVLRIEASDDSTD
jgi:hypothetical protein